MRENAYDPLYIFALNRATQRDDVELLHKAGIEHFTVCKGSYKGATENSYLVSAESFAKIRPYLRDCNQESALFLDNQRGGWLVFEADDYLHGPASVYLGEWRQVPVTVASACQAWTKVADQYWVCRK